MKTLFIGQNSIHLNEVDSTNSYATAMLRQINLLDGTLFYTFSQLKGRGQRENTWEAEPDKNIAMSVVLSPSFVNVNQQFLLTQITSLALADLMAELMGQSTKIAIKWPNDIYVNNRKIAGVLIENILKQNTIQNTVIGVGINVNQLEFKSAPNATSLKMQTGKDFDLILIIEKFCEYLEAYYLKLKSGKLLELNEKYLSNLYQLNEWKNYQIDEQVKEGMIQGVSNEGKLMVMFRDNAAQQFDLKQIIFL